MATFSEHVEACFGIEKLHPHQFKSISVQSSVAVCMTMRHIVLLGHIGSTLGGLIGWNIPRLFCPDSFDNQPNDNQPNGRYACMINIQVPHEVKILRAIAKRTSQIMK